MNENRVISRRDVQAYRLAGTKGATIMGHSDVHGLRFLRAQNTSHNASKFRLSVAICIGRRVTLLRWAFGPLGPIEEGTDITKNFSFVTVRCCVLCGVFCNVQESHLIDEPTQLCVYDTGLQGTVRMCYVNKVVLLSMALEKNAFRRARCTRSI